MWQSIVAGLALGIISSFHCVGMCGPIALSLPVQALKGAEKKIAVLLYHSGRMLTYCSLGLLFGLVGRHLYLAGFQKTLSVAAGIIILLVVILQRILKKKPTVSFAGHIFNAVQQAIYYLWNKPSLIKFLAIGMLNGLLPCGMVYFALVGALGFASPVNSAIFMAGFGLGTLPLMLLVHIFGLRYLSTSVRSKMRKAVPYFIVFMGAVLILRGLNLGIPFLSPYVGASPEEVISCH